MEKSRLACRPALAAAICLALAAAAAAEQEDAKRPQGRQASERLGPRSGGTVGNALPRTGPWTGDCQDRSGNGNHGRPHAVDFTAVGRSGQAGTAASFNGVDACIEVASSRSLAFGDEDFTIAAWVRLPETAAGPVGDILSKYDSEPPLRDQPVHPSELSRIQLLRRPANLQFGIDNAMESPWEDCGRPWPGNTFVGTLTSTRCSLCRPRRRPAPRRRLPRVPLRRRPEVGGLRPCRDKPQHAVGLLHDGSQGRSVLRDRDGGLDGRAAGDERFRPGLPLRGRNELDRLR